jgi:mono/diheme cytochrome c family protein
MKRNWILLFCLGVMTFLVGTAIAQEQAKPETPSKPPAGAPLLSANSKPADDSASPQPTHRTQARHTTKSEQSERAEGEQRFRENCGRCHQPPHKFSPRVMAAAIRHMRVRAMLTDEDMRLILKYMTQ